MLGPLQSDLDPQSRHPPNEETQTQTDGDDYDDDDYEFQQEQEQAQNIQRRKISRNRNQTHRRQLDRTRGMRPSAVLGRMLDRLELAVVKRQLLSCQNHRDKVSRSLQQQQQQRQHQQDETSEETNLKHLKLIADAKIKQLLAYSVDLETRIANNTAEAKARSAVEETRLAFSNWRLRNAAIKNSRRDSVATTLPYVQPQNVKSILKNTGHYNNNNNGASSSSSANATIAISPIQARNVTIKHDGYELIETERKDSGYVDVQRDVIPSLVIEDGVSLDTALLHTREESSDGVGVRFAVDFSKTVASSPQQEQQHEQGGSSPKSILVSQSLSLPRFNTVLLRMTKTSSVTVSLPGLSSLSSSSSSSLPPLPSLSSVVRNSLSTGGNYNNNNNSNKDKKSVKFLDNVYIINGINSSSNDINSSGKEDRKFDYAGYRSNLINNGNRVGGSNADADVGQGEDYSDDDEDAWESSDVDEEEEDYGIMISSNASDAETLTQESVYYDALEGNPNESAPGTTTTTAIAVEDFPAAEGPVSAIQV
ncbi:hypothetical protein HK100_005330 [Physocladia obscura]|uniref:Uncharacterized protein n=1 Tax=Physocladia obscura TaxID=109957 RepID=A0AAD5XFI3_9FUNG|nr:hypothetical protein HK100_005330 [Physocladia obscura]